MLNNPFDNSNEPLTKFESMLKTDDVYFFDAEDFEEIIHHYLNNGKLSLAKKAIKIGLNQHPSSIELKLLEIEVLVFENRLDKAEFLLDRLQVLAPNNDEIFIQRANIFSKKDNHESAIECLQLALSLTDDYQEIYSLMGMEYLFLDNYEKAKKSFMRCLEEDPFDYASLYNIVYCFEFMDDFNGAISYLNDYLEINPYCEIAWHQLGKQFMAKDMYKEALAAFDFAIISDDEFIGAYLEKGKVLEKLSRYKEAIENYDITLTLDEPTSFAYLRIGLCYEKLGMDDLAKDYLYHTVHEDPLLDKGWIAITDFYYNRKDYNKALYYINKAINIDSENVIYWKKSAIINKELNFLEEADLAFKKAIELGNYELDTWLSWSDVLFKIGEYEDGIQVLLQAIEFYPENEDLKYLLAGFYLKISKMEEGEYYLRKALILNKEKIDVFKSSFKTIYKTPLVQKVIKDIA